MYKFRLLLLGLFVSFYSLNYSQSSDSLNLPPNSYNNIPSLNFKDTDIKDIARAIAFEYKTNVMVENSITNKVSIALYDVSVFQALEILARDNGLEFAYDKSRFFIKTVKEKIPPPPPSPDPIIEFSSENEKISIEADNVNISKLVAELRKKTKKNFLMSPGLSGKITGELKSIPFETGLKNILQNNGYYFNLKDSIYYISQSAYFSSVEPQAKNKSPYWVSAQDNKVTIDVTNADIGKIIDDISNQLDLQVIKLAEPRSNITIKCRNVDVKQAFNYLFKGSKFSFSIDNNTYIIAESGSKNVENLRMFNLNFLRAENVKEQIPQSLTQDIVIQTSTEHNAIILIGSNENVHKLEMYLSEIDKPVPQVLIEAIVVDYNLTNMFKMGMKAGTFNTENPDISFNNDSWFPGLDVTASGKGINNLLKNIGTQNVFGKDINFGKLGKLPDNFYATLSFLEENDLANIKSRPILATINGQPASLKVGETQNYVFKDIQPITNQYSSSFIEKERIEKVDAFVTFEITPWVGTQGELTLKIKPAFQSFDEPLDSDERVIPAVRTKSFESIVKIKDGETIVLGGLIQDQVTNINSKFPILGDIPLLGELFTYKNKVVSNRELIVYITPHIFYGDDLSYQYFNYSEEK